MAEPQKQTTLGDEHTLPFRLTEHGIIITDPHGQPIFVDDGVRDILGCPGDDDVAGLVGRIQLADAVPLSQAVAVAREQGEWQGEGAGLTSDNHAVLLRVVARRLDAKDVDSAGAVVLVRDVTRERMMVKQVLESHQMELVERLSRGIAHEFKNLLTIIMAYTSLIETQVDDSFAEDISKIMETVDRANDLTRRLVSIARRPEPDFEDSDINEIVEEAGELLTKSLPSNVELASPPKADVSAVRVDRGALIRSIVHLCLNGGDAMPEGGVLTIGIEEIRIGEEDADDHPVGEPGRYVVLSILDQGYGMTRGVMQHLFEPFFTTKRGGSGLGLCSVRQTVSAMGGHLNIYSEPGSGTCVRVYLSALAPAVAHPVPAGPEPSRDATILVADDDALTLRAARRALERMGHRVLAASGGVDALSLFRKHADEIGLVILDVVMPDINGDEVYREISGIKPNVPVLVMSGFPQHTVAELVGLDDLHSLTKPFTHEALRDELAALLPKA